MLQEFAGLHADVLYPLMAGDVICHLTEADFVKVRSSPDRPCGAASGIRKGSKNAALHLRATASSSGKHQRQFLLVHQHAGRDRRDDVVAVFDGLEEGGQIGIFQLLRPSSDHRVPVSAYRSICASFSSAHGDAVVVEARLIMIFDHCMVRCMVAVTGDVDGNLAGGPLGGPDRQFRRPITVCGSIVLTSWSGCRKTRQRRLGVDDPPCLVAEACAEALDAGGRICEACATPGTLNVSKMGSVLVISRSRHLVLPFWANLIGLGAQHEVREVNGPFVGRQIGALGFGAEVAQVSTGRPDFHVVVLV